VEGLIEHIRSGSGQLVELEAIANRRGIQIRDPLQGVQIGAFTVLAPSRERYLRLIPSLDQSPNVIDRATDAVRQMADAIVARVRETWTGESLSENPPATSPNNETSIVQGAQLGEKRILLTGDVGPEGLLEAFTYASSRGLDHPHIVQVPHHGSRRNVKPSILNLWLGEPVPEWSTPRGSAYCSAAADDSKHPRKKVLNAFLRRGYPVWVTNGAYWLAQHNMLRDGWYSQNPQPLHSEVED
jgi:hypothetical protein